MTTEAAPALPAPDGSSAGGLGHHGERGRDGTAVIEFDIETAADTGQLLVWAAGAFALLVPRVYEPSRRRAQIWTFPVSPRNLPKLIIDNVEGEQTGMYLRPSVGYGAVRAVSQLTTALNAARSDMFLRTKRTLETPIDLCFSSDQTASHWCRNSNTVVVGGPKNNRVTARVLQFYGCQPDEPASADDRARLVDITKDLRGSGEVASGLGVATQGNTIFWFGEMYEGNVTGGEARNPGTHGYTGVDYGVILRLPSPANPERRMVVLFGSQTFGNEAAAAWLANVRNDKLTDRARRRLLARHDNIAVLVRSHVMHGSVSRPELIDIVGLPAPLAPRIR